jgi:hypothetical protein
MFIFPRQYTTIIIKVLLIHSLHDTRPRNPVQTDVVRIDPRQTKLLAFVNPKTISYFTWFHNIYLTSVPDAQLFFITCQDQTWSVKLELKGVCHSLSHGP